MTDMTTPLRQYQWRTTQEAMTAVLATMREQVQSAPPVTETVNGVEHDYRAEALHAIAEMEWLWLTDVDMNVTRRLVDPS